MLTFTLVLGSMSRFQTCKVLSPKSKWCNIHEMLAIKQEGDKTGDMRYNAPHMLCLKAKDFTEWNMCVWGGYPSFQSWGVCVCVSGSCWAEGFLADSVLYVEDKWGQISAKVNFTVQQQQRRANAVQSSEVSPTVHESSAHGKTSQQEVRKLETCQTTVDFNIISFSMNTNLN